MYNMFGTFDPKKNGSQKLTTYRAIELAWKLGLDFDFEGSMISGVAEFNKDFNAKKEEFYSLKKYSNKYLIVSYLREIIRIVKSCIKKK